MNKRKGLILYNDTADKNQLLLVLKITKAVKQAGGRAMLVGGYVRDQVMRTYGYKSEQKDIDLEVYGLEFNDLLKVLKKFGKPNVVGASFSVIKLNGIDISIPRTDKKIGKGHRGFTVSADAGLSFKDAARRRDFTINAMLLDPLTHEVIDPYNGAADIKNKILRAVDLKTFGQDALRALRAMQFAGRFEFNIDPATAQACKKLNLKELSKERIGEEWVKLLTKAKHPIIGMEAAWQLEIIKKLHPQIFRLGRLAWRQAEAAADKAAKITARENIVADDQLVVMLGALCQRIKNIKKARAFLHTLSIKNPIIEKVVSIVQANITINASDAYLRNLSVKLQPATIEELLLVTEAVGSKKQVVEIKKIKKRASALGVLNNPPKPLVSGKDLLKLGFKSGVGMGKILKEVYTAQIEGKLKSKQEAKKYLLYIDSFA